MMRWLRCQENRTSQPPLKRANSPIHSHWLVPVVVTCRNRSWELKYLGNIATRRINSGWKHFAIDNKLEIGDGPDGMVFELMSRETLHFKAQILRGEVPTIPDDVLAAETVGLQKVSISKVGEDCRKSKIVRPQDYGSIDLSVCVLGKLAP